MFAVLGLLVVTLAILGGYLMEHGHIRVLLQPAELLIIGGAALGTLLIANPVRTLKKLLAAFSGIFSGSKYSRDRYLETLKMAFELLSKARKDSLVALEGDVEEPEKSSIFTKYPGFLKDHHARDFLCDTLRMVISGGVEPFDLDQMMDLDMEVHHHESAEPIAALSTMADSLPGLGIVAAVLGVVITMGSLAGLRSRSEKRSRLRWLEHFSASFCVMALWDR